MLSSHNTIPSKSGSLRTDVARLEEELVLKWETGTPEVRVILTARFLTLTYTRSPALGSPALICHSKLTLTAALALEEGGDEGEHLQHRAADQGEARDNYFCRMLRIDIKSSQSPVD